MAAVHAKRFSIRWRDSHLIALGALVFLSASLLGFRAFHRPRAIGKLIPLDSVRVAQAREQVDPNTASPASLRRLSGIGPAKTQAIVEFRIQHGPHAFGCADDLDRVCGLGPALISRLAGHLSFPTASAGGAGGDFELHAAQSSWDEASLTQAIWDSWHVHTDVIAFSAAAGNFVDIDVTATVTAWMSGSSPNNGWALESAGGDMYFASSDYALGPALWPQLTIVTLPPPAGTVVLVR